MKEKLGNDLILKVFSLVLAILLWLFVINTEDPVITKSFSNIPVDMLNEQVLDELNRTYKITEGSTVSFTVKGKKQSSISSRKVTSGLPQMYLPCQK